MSSHFTADFFIGNRARLASTFADKKLPVIATANGLMQRGSDSGYKFHQDADFWYLTGIDEPDVILFMAAGKEYLIVPSRELSHEAFNGSVDHKFISKRSGISTVLGEEEGWKLINRVLNRTKKVASFAPPPPYSEKHGIYANPARTALVKKLRASVGGLRMVNVSKNIVNLRVIKQPQEIKAIQAAIDITVDSVKAALSKPKLAKYAHEFEIQAELEKQFRTRGSSGPAFDSIVAGGLRGVTLHYTANSHKLSHNELLVVDVGAEVEHYAADITRTVNFRPLTKRQRQVYDAVKRTQDYAKDMLKPGVMPRDYELAVAEYIGEELKNLGLFKQTTPKNIRKYFPHSTSHFLGLNVHDEGDYTQPLKEGMVLTVEPGIYIPEEGIGIRLEDDALITKNGLKVLSGDLPSLLQ